jgi:hypothetical protein
MKMFFIKSLLSNLSPESKKKLKPILYVGLTCVIVLGVFALAGVSFLAYKGIAYISQSDVYKKSVNLSSISELELKASQEIEQKLKTGLVSQQCLNAATNLANPSNLLTQPISSLWLELKNQCFENKKQEVPSIGTTRKIERVDLI